MVHDVSQAEHERVQKGENLLSIVTPAYNEARNLPVLYERLGQALAGLNVAWEWIVVDDHSGDDTFAVVASIARCDSRVRAIRLARNLGSHTAIACGLHHAAGDCAVILAADLQDPPETLPALLDRWRAGAQGVWAVGARREGEGRQHRGLCPPGSLDAGRRRAADEHYLVPMGRNIRTVGSNDREASLWDFSRSAALPTTKVVTTNPCRTYATVY